MGFPTTLGMNLVSVFDPNLNRFSAHLELSFFCQGMLVGWGILSPLAKHKGWAPGAVCAPSFFISS